MRRRKKGQKRKRSKKRMMRTRRKRKGEGKIQKFYLLKNLKKKNKLYFLFGCVGSWLAGSVVAVLQVACGIPVPL